MSQQAEGGGKSFETNFFSESLVLLPFNICKINVAPTKIIFPGNTLNFLHVFFTTRTDLRARDVVIFISIMSRHGLRAVWVEVSKSPEWLVTSLYFTKRFTETEKIFYMIYYCSKSIQIYLSETWSTSKMTFYLTSDDDRK